MKLFVTYELSPFTAGGTGTYLNHVLKILSEKGIETAVLFGLSKPQVDQFRAELSERVIPQGPLPELFSAFDLAPERNGPNVYWNRSAMFCDAILKIVSLRNVDYVEFFDYCGPAYHLLMEKCLNLNLKDIEIAIRFHNTIELIDRASGRFQLPGPACPYGLERRAFALADRVIVPGQKSWDESAAELYGVGTNRLRVTAPPFARDNLPMVHKKRAGIAFVGRPSILKGFDTFLTALNILAANDAVGELPHVTIIGPAETVVGALDIAFELKKLPALKSNISALGHVPPAELMQILGKYDIIVFPNRTESYCYALHEARLAGARLVINTIPAFVEHLEPSDRVRLFDGTPRDLAAQLAVMLQTADTLVGADLQSLRDAYVRRSTTLCDVESPLPLVANQWSQSGVCIFSQRSNASVDGLAALKAAWVHAFPKDEILPKLLIDGRTHTDGHTYFVSIFADGVTADQFSRARRMLDFNAAINCVLVFPNLLEESLVEWEATLPIASAHLSVKPAAVVWRFDRPGAAADHIAKGMDRIDDAATLMRIANGIVIGASDHPMALRSRIPASRPTRFVGAQYEQGVTVVEAELRMREMSLADQESDYFFLVRGHIRLPKATRSTYDRHHIEVLFGFFSGESGDLESWFGGLHLRRDGADVVVEIISESAEFWTYRGGRKAVHFLHQGQLELSDAHDEVQVSSLLSKPRLGDIEGNAIEDYGDESVVIYLCESAPYKASSEFSTCLVNSDHSFTVANVEAACERLAFIAGKNAHIVMSATLLREGSIEQLASAARFVERLKISVFLRADLLFSQEWMLHNGIFDALKFAETNSRICLELVAPAQLAGTLQLLGIPCETNPNLKPSPKPAKRWLLWAQEQKRISILLSSTGAFSGAYGHLLAALALIRNDRPELDFKAEIMRPNHESEMLIHDLGLTSRVDIRARVPTRRHDLVLEVYPDGQLSVEATIAVDSGAAAVVALASKKWVNETVAASYVTDWEASDEITSNVIPAIERWYYNNPK